MKSRRHNFVVTMAQPCLISLFLLVSLTLLTMQSTAQNPNPRPAKVEAAQGTDQDCEKIKQDIKELSDALAELSADIQRLNDQLDDVEKHSKKLEADQKAWQEKYKNDIRTDYEYIRGIFLDARAKLASARRGFKNDIEDEQRTIQAIKDIIADLLNKLGNCGSKTSTPTPQSNTTPKGAGNQVGYHVDTKTANGLIVTTFDTPQGKIKVNLTDDLAGGDTISGTVETEPAGKNDAERVQNQAELNGYVVELEGQKTNVGDKKITCNIPTTLSTEAKTIVLQHNGQTVATTEIPISATPLPTPAQFTLPTGGQQGRPIQIKGPCDGVFSPNDSVKIGPTILPPVAKSPRSLVVLNTSDVVGPTNIECKENGVAMQCPFRNLGIKLSAPKLNLLRGETTTLHVVVLGLAGIKEDVPLDLINDSPSVIKFSGGEVQRLTIPSIQVQADGTYALDRTLTGIMSGGFGITATVRWSNVCKHP